MEMAIPLFLRRDAVQRPSVESVAPASLAAERRIRSLPQQRFSATFLRCLAVHMYFAEHPSALE
jgi:hypothetical protein